MTITKEEILSVFSEFRSEHLAGHAPGYKGDCIVCETLKQLFTSNGSNLDELDYEVWAPIAQACIPLPVAALWGATDKYGFHYLVAICITMGIKIGRRQMFAELCEEGLGKK